MFLANLVFADIDGHSNMPVAERAVALKTFWRICHEHEPKNSKSYSLSFYDVDNDSLMCGFSGMPDLELPSDALLWAVRLRADLAKHGVPVSFGVALAGGRYQVDWDKLPGFLPELRSHLYFPDDEDMNDGRVDRRKLIGDALILAARLLSLAKKANIGIALAYVPGDHSRLESMKTVQRKFRESGLAEPQPLDEHIASLPSMHQRWLYGWGIEIYGMS